ncbi:MAG: hypothetical protein ACPLPX_02845 [Candidatus Kapaibacteriota bacterium]
MNAKTRIRKATETQLKRLGPTHVLLFLALLIFFFFVVFRSVIPWGTAQFVVPLFKPSGDKLEKIGFVKFQGLVWASTTKEKAEEIVKQGQVEIHKDLINKEYIFDFTFKPRNEREHGYVKEALQFYVKSEVIGENAIILDPELAFSILALDIALILSLLITMVLPTNIGFMSLLFDRQIDNTKTKIRLQTGFPEDVVELLVMPDDLLVQKDRDEVEKRFRLVWERTIGEAIASPRQSIRFEDVFDEATDFVKFRNITLYSRIKDYFSDFVLKEIEDTKDGLLWRRNHFLIFKGLRLYMAHHFTEKYSNNVTGLAYGGAAFLIVAVGIRGLKFIPATKPSFILLAIFLEFTMLTMLSVTLIYTEEEERMDRMLKKMEDANKSQLEALRSQQYDIHQLTSVLVGQSAEIIKSRVERAISEYLTSDDHVKRMIAEEISQKILIGLKESFLNEQEK